MSLFSVELFDGRQPVQMTEEKRFSVFGSAETLECVIDKIQFN